MKLRYRSSVMGNARLGMTLGVLMAAIAGCSDDDAPPPDDIPDAASTLTGETAETTGGGGEESSSPTSEPNETLTIVDETTEGNGATSAEPTGGPTDTSAYLSSSPTTGGNATSSDLPTLDTTGIVVDPTSDTGAVVDTTADLPTDGTDDTGYVPPNLVANWDFEVDTAGWYSWGNDGLVVSTDKANTGNQSLLIPADGSAVGPGATMLSNPVPGGVYEVTFWATTGAGSASVRITRQLACASNQYLWVVGNTTITSDGWSQLTGTFDVPEDCDSTSFQVYIEGDTNDADVYIDTVSVRLISGGGGDETTGADTSGVETTGGGETTGGPVDVDSGVIETTEPVQTTDGDAGVVDTTDTPVEGDASLGDTTLPEGDASVGDVTSAVVETSAPADTSAADPYGPNLHTNPGFESGQDWWWFAFTDAATTATVTDSVAHSGTYSMLVAGRTATWHGVATDLLGAGLTTPVQEGVSYHLTAWVRISGAPTDTVGLTGVVTCDGNTTYPWLVGGTVSNSGWTELSGDFTAPTCVTSLSEFRLAVNTAAAGVDIYLDDVSISQVLP